MQGISDFIPTEEKVNYLNHLLKVGFDTLDFGSFVSPKAIPQMRDTREVLNGLNLPSNTHLLAIVANKRGAEDASQFEQIQYLGFPLSISETFQQRNTNSSIKESLDVVRSIREICEKVGKTQVVYLSMGFGNPYGDPYSPEVVEHFVEMLAVEGIQIISLADTIGTSTPELIHSLFSSLISGYPEIEFGAHLHSTPDSATEKINAVIDSGCQRMDGALLGYGGCPMAKDDLTGNLDTAAIANILDQKNDLSLDKGQLKAAKLAAQSIFSKYI